MKVIETHRVLVIISFIITSSVMKLWCFSTGLDWFHSGSSCSTAWTQAKTTFIFYMFLCFLIRKTPPVTVSCVEGVEGLIGDDVLLPCVNGSSSDKVSVNWTDKDQNPVFNIKENHLSCRLRVKPSKIEWKVSLNSTRRETSPSSWRTSASQTAASTAVLSYMWTFIRESSSLCQVSFCLSSAPQSLIMTLIQS